MRRRTGLVWRPVQWLVLALVLAVPGVLLAGVTVQALARPADLGEVPRCDQAFADDCLTVRDARADEHVWNRGDAMDGADTWRLSVREDWLVDGDGGGGAWPREVQLRSQDGRGELHEGARVELTFAGEAAIWIRLPSGTVLETVEHPWQAGPARGSLALVFLGGAVWATEVAVRGARRNRSWLRAAPLEAEPGVGMVLFLAGGLGAVAQLAYPRPAPLLVVVLALSGWVGWLYLRHPRIEPAERHGLTGLGALLERAEPPDRLGLRARVLGGRRRAGVAGELKRLAATFLLTEDRRRNGHLAVVVRPSAPRSWRLDPDRVAAAAGRALATRGWVDAAPDLKADGWFRDGDGVRLTRGLGDGGRVWEDGLLEVTARDDGVILLVCGRGTSRVAEAWPRLDGADPVSDVPVVLPALLLGLTEAALLLAAELSAGDAPGQWSAGVRVDRLRGAVARELLLIGADPVPLDRAEYLRTVQVSDARLRADAVAVGRQLVARLLGELGVAAHYGTA